MNRKGCAAAACQPPDGQRVSKCVFIEAFIWLEQYVPLANVHEGIIGHYTTGFCNCTAHSHCARNGDKGRRRSAAVAVAAARRHEKLDWRRSLRANAGEQKKQLPHDITAIFGLVK
jgi:hypothetical protein